jgi:ubiquinone biosynthesis monooxygenase Coq7
MSPVDSLIVEFDRALRTVAGEPRSRRASPGDGVADAPLDEGLRRRAAALMRVNHCGEVCAQALYQGQALASGDPGIKAALGRAAAEEVDHLAWSAQRIRELGGRTSFLNPLWYAGALVLGFAAGRLGDRWNLGFLAETERQVEDHLQGHLERLGERDAKTRTVIEVMQRRKPSTGERQRRSGRASCRGLSDRECAGPAKVMTTASYWI